MIAAFVLSLAATVTSPELSKAEVALAIRSLERLAALPTDKPGAAAIEQASRKVQRAELETLLIYLRKVQEVIAGGNDRPEFHQNMLIVAQQVAVVGKVLALTPEEALCWDRVRLDFAAAYRRHVALQVQAGKYPLQNHYQAMAQYERVRKEYRDTLAELVKNAR